MHAGMEKALNESGAVRRDMSMEDLGPAFFSQVNAMIMPNGERVAEVYADRGNPAAPRLVMAVFVIGSEPLGIGVGPLVEWRALGHLAPGDLIYYDEIDAPSDGAVAGWELVWRAPEA